MSIEKQARAEAEKRGSEMEYTFRVTDAYNDFGGGHAYLVHLYYHGQRVRVWDYDASLPFATTRVRRRINHVINIYGATRET